MNKPEHHAINSVEETVFVHRGLVFHDDLFPDGTRAVSICADENGFPIDVGGWKAYGVALTKERACEIAVMIANNELNRHDVRDRLVFSASEC